MKNHVKVGYIILNTLLQYSTCTNFAKKAVHSAGAQPFCFATDYFTMTLRVRPSL